MLLTNICIFLHALLLKGKMCCAAVLEVIDICGLYVYVDIHMCVRNGA